MDAEWAGYGEKPVYDHNGTELTRGCPVLQWAGQRICENKALVEFLVWSNPSNLRWASLALQANPDVTKAALSSPFYWQKSPNYPVDCVLKFSNDDLCAKKTIALAALACSGYEFQHVSTALRADPYVVAWAGAPVGSFKTRKLSNLCFQALNNKHLLEMVNANWMALAENKDLLDFAAEERKKNIFKLYPLSEQLAQWPCLAENKWSEPVDKTTCNWSGPDPIWSGLSCAPRISSNKLLVCEELKQTLNSMCPLCLRVAPPVRNILWPTCEQ
jgi:hypothetical protein